MIRVPDPARTPSPGPARTGEADVVADGSGLRRNRRRSPGVDTLIAVAVWLGGALVFFREQWDSGFSHLMGNVGDTRLIAYLSEHWFQVLHGSASWRDPTFFYPVKGLLGWSDAFFLYQVFYAPLRELGCDPFLALQLTVVLLSLVGFVSFFLLVRRAFDAPRYAAAAGALAFTFSNALWLHAAESQLNGVYLVPPLLLLGLTGWRRIGVRPVSAAVLLGGAGAGAALLFFTTYYVAVFSALASAVVVVLVAVMRPRRTARWVGERWRAAWPPVLAAVGCFGLGLVPFLLTYLPARRAAHGTPYAQVLGFGIVRQDLFNVGTGNVLWSSLIHRLSPATDVLVYEHTYAVTPVAMLLVVLGGAAAAWRLAVGRARDPRTARAAVTLSAATVVVWLLPLRTRVGSPWSLVWHIPGVSAIRAIDRIQIVTGLLAALAIVAAVAEVGRGPGRRRHSRSGGSRPALTVGLAVALAVVVVEQLNTSPVSAISRPEQVRLIDSVPQPPAACRAFYVVDPRARPFFAPQIDAMLISQRVSLPTINGYTGYRPAGWGLVVPSASDYPAEVRAWEAAHHLATGMCHLDLRSMRWGTDPPLPSGAQGG